MPRDDDELSCLRALVDDFILDVAERDPARVAKVIADVCERLAAERYLSWAELETAVEVLLLEWQERLSDRLAICTETLLNATGIRRLLGEIPMYHHILIPTDGSPLSGSAVEKGIALAKTLGAKVTVLTAVEPFPVMQGLPQSYDAPDEYTRRAHAEAEPRLAAAEQKAKQVGVPCEVVKIEHGQPFEAIIETAGARGCDLIAMASHGRRGISALLLGSETMKVLMHSKLPVLVYR